MAKWAQPSSKVCNKEKQNTKIGHTPFYSASIFLLYKGELKSLYTVDIGKNFSEYANLSFIFGGRCIHQETVHVIEPVGKLKKLCSKLVRKSPM